MSLRKKIIATAVGALSLGGVATAAYAGSDILPGISAGVPLGAPLPQGVFVLDLPSIGYRDSNPGQTVPAFIPAWIIWSTPWDIAGAHLSFEAATPVANVAVHGVFSKGGSVNPVLGGMLNWNLGNGFFFGVHADALVPVINDLSAIGVTRNFAQFMTLGALSYLNDGWNLTATGYFATGQSGSPLVPGSWGASWFNYDLTATKKVFGKFEIGAVGFGSTDLDSPFRGYAKQSQFALGPLIGYDFGTVNIQIKATRDVAQTNYGGYESRLWANLIIPVWVAAPPPAAVAAKY